MPLLIVVFGIALLLLLMVGLRLNAFIALIIVALVVGLAEGMNATDALKSIENGVGSTLGSLSLIVGFGAMLGKLLADSGAAQRISLGLIRNFSRENIQWACVITGFVVGLPMFYNAAFVLVFPLIVSIAASTGLSLIYIGIPMCAALSVSHGFLPPHPGPTAIGVMYKADIGLTLLYGIIIAIPTIIIAGPFFSRTLKRIKPELPKLYEEKTFAESEMPGYGVSLFTALVPVLLMAVAALISLVLPAANPIRKLFDLIGNPVIAMLIAVLIAIVTLGLRRGRTMDQVMRSVTNSISDVAMIMLIIGGGGALKQVLVDSGVGKYITELMQGYQLSPLVLAWTVASLLRVSLGSATVAALTTVGIVLPAVTADVSPELMVLATGAGSLMFSHVNDPGFWLFKEYFGLTLSQTFASWSIMETIVSICGLIGVLAMNAVIG